MLYILHLGLALYMQRQRPSRLTEHLVGDERELVCFLQENVERGFELENGFEDGAAAQDVQTEAGAGEGDGEAADVAEVADSFCADEGEDDVW
jgi:hypothetical protein